MAKAGRKPNPNGPDYPVSIHLRVSEKESDAIRKKAEKAGLNVNEFIRRALRMVKARDVK